MKRLDDITLRDVQAVYDGLEGDLWELIMGEQIHLGGMASSRDLAECAGVAVGMKGVDLCCCTGAGMRFLTRFMGVAAMRGVDATARVVERGRRRCREQGLADRIEFTLADVCDSGLPAGQADFVWGEDAWCYVADKPRLIAEAIRLTRPGGLVAFTDWVEGPVAMSDEEARRCLAFMKFPNVLTLEEYCGLLKGGNCEVVEARDTGRFAPCVDMYLEMLGGQLAYDALRIVGFDQALMEAMGREMAFLQSLAHAGKISQGLIVARSV